MRRAAPPRRRGVQLHCLFREPRVEGGELRPRLACLLDDPVVLAGGAAEAVEPGERLVERVGAQQNRERVALVRPFVESPDEHLELGLGDSDGLLRDSELLRGGGAVPRDLRPAGGEGAEIALCAAARLSSAYSSRVAAFARASSEPAPHALAVSAWAACERRPEASAARAIGTAASRAKPVKTATRRAAPLVECVPTRSRTVASIAGAVGVCDS